MLDILISLRTSWKVPYVHIDSPVFRLHWCFTSSILLVISLFMITMQFMGTPISCKSDNSDSQTIDQYCLAHSTYTVRSEYQRSSYDFDEEEVRYVSYYKWVGIMLLFQSFLFYLPRIIWKNLERGKIRGLLTNLDMGLVPEGESKQQQKELVDYLYSNLKTHDSWAYWYYFCELLALLNVIFQIFLINKFLNGVFLSLGLDILTPESSDLEERIRPVYNAFPTMTKCLFSEYYHRTDALCMLPLNAFNEYIYKFLWFWLFFLTLCSVSVLALRIVILLAPQARILFLKRMFCQVKDGVVNTLVSNTKAGDWLLFDLLCNNLEGNMFDQVMEQLAGKLKNIKYDNQENLLLCERA